MQNAECRMQNGGKNCFRKEAVLVFKELSFASQKNDMLLRNMIFRLNVEMIDSPEGEYDMFA